MTNIAAIYSVYTTKFLACVCETDVTSPWLHRSYSCGTVSSTCKVGKGRVGSGRVGSGQLHVYIDDLLRGNLQKRDRLGGKPTPLPWGRLEPGSLGKKGRLGGEPTPRPWGRLELGSLGKKERLGGEPTPTGSGKTRKWKQKWKWKWKLKWKWKWKWMIAVAIEGTGQAPVSGSKAWYK